MTIQSSPVVVLPLMGGGKVAVPIVTPGIGDKCITIPLQGGSQVVTKLWTPSSGEKVIVMPLKGGGKVAIKIGDGIIIYTVGVVIDFGGGGIYTYSVQNTGDNWNNSVLFYGIPGDYYPWDFQSIELTCSGGGQSGGCISVGAARDFYSSPEQVFTIAIKMTQSGVFIDAIQFRNYVTNEIYDLNGNGGFETGGSGWTLSGNAIITDTEYYEGSHCLKLL